MLVKKVSFARDTLLDPDGGSMEAATKIAIAIWEGSNGERGGIKAFSQAWRELQLQA